jgi:glycosyltransferase involved in cell wall biosynthesis
MPHERMEAPSRQTVAIGVATAGDPTDPTAYSGVPASLLAALADLGAEAQPLAADLGAGAGMAAALLAIRRPGDVLDLRAALRRRRAEVMASSEMATLRSIALRRAIRRRHPDAVIQIGCEYRAPDGVPFVTFEDSTVVQARRAYGWSHLQIGEGTLAAWVEMQRHCYEQADACCTYNHWAAESIVEDYGQPREKVKVVGVGVNNPTCPPVHRSWSSPRFLFVGFDWSRKNGDRVVTAFSRLRERIPTAELHLVGGHPRIDVPGVTGHGPLSLDAAESRERVVSLFQAATCFVMPSLHEPTGIVHAEAGAAGIASIGTICGGVSTVIGEGGRLVDPTSDESILEAMLELSDPHVAQSLGALALERSHLFTWEKVAQRLLRALNLPGSNPSSLADFL